MEKLFEINWANKSWDDIDAILAERIARNSGKRPKREGFVVERIAAIDNLRAADAEAQNGKIRTNRYIRRHNQQAEKDLRDLQTMILTLEFPPAEYIMNSVRSDAGKIREIAKQKYFPWRILNHAIMRVIAPAMLRYMVYDSFACVKGKGLHFGVKRMKMMLRRYPEYRYFVKTDYKKFYQSIPHDLIIAELRKRFKDEHLFRLIETALFTFDSGDEIERILEDEERKKRHTHWCIYQPANREFCGQLYRPRYKGEDARKMLPAILR